MITSKGLVMVDAKTGKQVAAGAVTLGDLSTGKFLIGKANRTAKTIRLIRTEDIKVMQRYNLSVGAQNVLIPRGLAESSSLMREVYVYGSELTYQDVPHSRVFASYLYSRRPDESGASLHSDGENEFVFIPFNIPLQYIRSRRRG